MISMTKSGGTQRSARARDRSEVSRAQSSVCSNDPATSLVRGKRDEIDGAALLLQNCHYAQNPLCRSKSVIALVTLFSPKR
jgi:hypothetical protein